MSTQNERKKKKAGTDGTRKTSSSFNAPSEIGDSQDNVDHQNAVHSVRTYALLAPWVAVSNVAEDALSPYRRKGLVT